MKYRLFYVLMALLIASTNAQEMRQVRRIPTPTTAKERPPNAKAVKAIKPISPDTLRAAMNEFADSWNGEEMGEMIDDSFFDSSRLGDAMIAEVPRDAKLRLLSVRGSQVLEQYIAPRNEGGQVRISMVTITADTQIEFNNASNGFVRIPGSNEFLIEVREPLP